VLVIILVLHYKFRLNYFVKCFIVIIYHSIRCDWITLSNAFSWSTNKQFNSSCYGDLQRKSTSF